MNELYQRMTKPNMIHREVYLIKLFIVATVLAGIMAFAGCADQVDPRYELAGQYDDSTVENAQKSMAHIEESADIEIRDTYLGLAEFGSSYAGINAAENWIQPTYTFIAEDMSKYRNAPDEINGIILTKLKAKDKIDAEFGDNSTTNEPQGICADVQQEIYDTVLTMLTDDEREKYETQGKQLYFFPDNDTAPLDKTTNPVNQGSFWLDVDPATKITQDGDNYYYEPLSLYVEFDDPAFEEDKYRGVRYCKFLSHQAILAWMTQKSFKRKPVLVTATIKECNRPSSIETTTGSCIFYFVHSKSYYCSDYTGTDYTSVDVAEEKCMSRDAKGTLLSPIYSEVPCSERTAEIEELIPGYIGPVGLCAIHCQGPNEFLWNVYTDSLEESCEGFDYFTTEELDELMGTE